MPTFDRPRKEVPDAEQKMVFEEVAEGEGGIVFEEDPVEIQARAILNLEKQVADAQRKANSGRDGERALLVAEVLLAKAKYEQARYNEEQGKSKNGETDRLIDEWQAVQDRLDVLNNQSINTAREAAFKRFGNDESSVGEDTKKLWENLTSR